jgi:hypothetical protein
MTINDIIKEQEELYPNFFKALRTHYEECGGPPQVVLCGEYIIGLRCEKCGEEFKKEN